MQAGSVGFQARGLATAGVRQRKAFTYVANFASTIAAAATGSAVVKLHPDSDFELTKMTWAAFDNAAPTSDTLLRARVRIQVTDQTSGVRFFSGFIYAGHVCGEALQGSAPPFSLPRYLAGNSSLLVEIRNDTPSTTLTGVSVGFLGNKLFR